MRDVRRRLAWLERGGGGSQERVDEMFERLTPY